jgi:hypothetical protein
MVGSQLADDPKMDHRDRADPRWTPTLHEAWVAVQKRKEDAAQIVALMYERDGWKEYSAALVADIEEMRKRESSLSEQLRIMKTSDNQQLVKAWNDGAEEGMNACANDIRPPTGPEVERLYLKNPYSRKPQSAVMEDRKPIHEIGKAMDKKRNS